MTPEQQDWVRDAIPVGASLLSYVLGKASRGGADRATIKALRVDVAELKSSRIEQGATLATHTAMHEIYARTIAAMNATLTSVSKDVSYVRGRIDARGEASSG